MLGLGEGTSRGTTRKAVSDDPVPARSWLPVAGGAIWILATLQYAIVQVIVASAWHHPAYSWLNNYISDLGNTACRQRCRTALLPTCAPRCIRR